MTEYFAYIRVSTARQGERGSSLQEQRSAIEGYAQRFGLVIKEWVEERETAAKRGRAGFTKMLGHLRAGEARGVIIHKIDRSARNLKDWADLGELIDLGVDVHFANESLDLTSRGGRLSADIQAVVAADYIRNLRDEVRKGFYGRLHQGVYPLPAPVGYLDQGKGVPKAIDPVMGPLVRQAFELYASGQFTLDALVPEMERRGLRNRPGKPLKRSMLSRIFNNPFYIGIIHIRSTGERFEGKHNPLVRKALFDRTQDILSGKIRHLGLKHGFLYRRLFRCGSCTRALAPERQKGHVYYRCHGRECPGTSVREQLLSDEIERALSAVHLSPSLLLMLRAHVETREADMDEDHADLLKAARLRLAQLEDREHRLTDALIERLIDRPVFDDRRKALLGEKTAIREEITAMEGGITEVRARVWGKFELAETASRSHESVISAEKLEVVKRLSSNLVVSGKSVVVELSSFFQRLAEQLHELCGRPYRPTIRTSSAHEFSEWFIDESLKESTEAEAREGSPRARSR